MKLRAVTAEAPSSPRAIVDSVGDPELPLLTLADLGIVRDVVTAGGTVVVTVTPTYSGCPAMAMIRHDIVRRLREGGYADVEVRTRLSPPWTSDWITEAGRRKLAAGGYSPPARVGSPPAAVPLRLSPPPRALSCPQCGSPLTEVVSEFGATPCKAIYRCRQCREPFEHVKEI